ncbi:1-deoxy-D-xylulose-5-phosphate reductoisomerase [Sphingomonas jatrophae]|uniref:1-deoxy-D-xylulose 5-phosphate reductoisomerase n=1 Tax=Sphingomonas jatrophae TaxID=1166337 RepID=A0A1I6JPI2_9SPHN|nr:1-deoxy-D-xylulose-5-phosphate reductoisomerase [Sphingomonas jatrophae]SFR80864.1 1-deoxy-D-xylulose 5-phosphate reductoisomerase [Sphingomonas jatrophae]
MAGAGARSVTILGATGSIGASTLDLIEREPERYDVVALTAHRNVAELADAARRTRARFAAVADVACGPELADALAGSGIATGAGPEALVEAARMGADWTMAAIVGCAGLAPTMAALEGGRTVALANKEALVSAGALMTAAARAHGATLLPVDSEHNAIFQCFPHDAPERVRRILLTASGGPFRTMDREAMRGMTPAQAVKHPNWSMGTKISVDSATLMNKGLELIEAAHLFPVPLDRFEIVVHPQSVIHSMVETIDGSVLAQLGLPDMRVPISYTLAWPERMATPCTGLDFAALGRLDFEAPDPVRFPALTLTRDAMAAGGAKPAILNAANEVAVAAFLEGRAGFLDITEIVLKTLERYDPPAPGTLNEVLGIDARAREVARGALETMVA